MVTVVGSIAFDAVKRTRGTDTAGVARIAGGRTFFWRGECGWDEASVLAAARALLEAA